MQKTQPGSRDWALIRLPFPLELPRVAAWTKIALQSSGGRLDCLALRREAPVRRLREKAEETRAIVQDMRERYGGNGFSAVSK
jgi:hypothetical protein